MLRRLFMILSVLSLLLCVATCVLWVRSYWLYDYVWWNYGTVSRLREFKILSTSGGCAFYFSASADTNQTHPEPTVHNSFWGRSTDSPVASDGYRYEVDIFGEEPRRWALGHHSYRGSGRTGTTWYVVVPDYAIAASLLLLTLVRRCRRILARQGAGLCPACGYDLRATPDRCPECGAVSASANVK
jgi:hypothetical protein